MKLLVIVLLLFCLGFLSSTVPDFAIGSATRFPQTRSRFQHIVVIVQENRTPDNLFHGLCTPSSKCSTTPTSTQYDIQTRDWLDKTTPTGITQPEPVPLASTYGLDHEHRAFTKQCDLDHTTGKCKMDGAAGVGCSPASTCPAKPQFKFVDNSTGVLNPYLTLARQYGWANFMFQTNQGPSFPAHQFIFGATSAPSPTDDHAGTFAAENPNGGLGAGCIAQPSTLVNLINSAGAEDPKNKIFPCFEHDTVADLLEPRSISWRYYTPGAGSIWSAPDAIKHICVPMNGACTGTDFVNNVDLRPQDVLRDASSPTCKLRQVSWVIPSGQNSDHAGYQAGAGGPSWVASIVNAIGGSTCKNPDGSSYWDTTAIFITWDDWGGWYDHEPPTLLGSPQGGYQYGFRVPLIVVSAFTPAGLIGNGREDFGSIIRFIEQNFGITEGALTFADARATHDLTGFFRLDQAPRPFRTIPSKLNAAFFLNDKTPMNAPDDD